MCIQHPPEIFEIAGVQVAGNALLTSTIHSQGFTPISQMCIQHPPEMFEIAGAQVAGNVVLTITDKDDTQLGVYPHIPNVYPAPS